MIIDTHVHLIDGFRGYTGRGAVTSDTYGRVRFSTGERERIMPVAFADTRFPLETAVEYMNDAGIDKAFLMQATFYGLLNELVGDAVTHYPDRFVGCACLDPMSKYWREILGHCVEDLGLRGLKFEMSEDYGLTGVHPDLRLNEPRFRPLFRQLAEYQIPLLIDPGWSKSLGNRPDDLKQVLDDNPDLTVVVCHLGQPTHPIARRNAEAAPSRSPGAPVVIDTADDESWNSWLDLGAYPRVYFDLAILHIFAQFEEYPYVTAQAYVREAAARVGAERLMWSSDLPYGLLIGTYQEVLNWVRKHCEFLTPDERAQVLGETAARVFGFDTSTAATLSADLIDPHLQTSAAG